MQFFASPLISFNLLIQFAIYVNKGFLFYFFGLEVNLALRRAIDMMRKHQALCLRLRKCFCLFFGLDVKVGLEQGDEYAG